MIIKKQSLLLLSLALLTLAAAQNTPHKVFCNYDSRSYHREGSSKFLSSDIEHALGQCTHIIYGYAGLDGSEFKIKSLDPDLDLDPGKGNYKAVTSFKRRYPDLNVLLSIGGWADTEESEKYLALLRDSTGRASLVSSTAALIRKYGFDGIDLAWQFPLVRVKQRSQLGSIWHKIKKTFGYAKGSKDLLLNEHKLGFTALIKEMKSALRPDGYMVTASVIPNTNYTLYWDLHQTSPYLDAIHVQAFDYLTPDKKITPEVADYPAPLYATYDRNPNFSVDVQIKWFLNNGAPPQKLILGIPTYGRSWKLDSNSATSGIPPIEADGGIDGPLTHLNGIYSYPEICFLVAQGSVNKTDENALKRVPDPNKRLGSYAWRPIGVGRDGIWVGYEDPETAKLKAEYAKNLRLGGIGIYDLSMDDYRGLCDTRYPLVKAAREGLQ